MLSTAEIETKLLEIKPVLAEKFHVSKIGYFGSYLKGQQTDASDLDLVVEFSAAGGAQTLFHIRRIFRKIIRPYCRFNNKERVKGVLGLNNRFLPR